MTHDPVFVRGDKLACEGFPDHSITVRRAAKDGSWIDVFVCDNRTRISWTKRLKLPLASVWSRADA